MQSIPSQNASSPGPLPGPAPDVNACIPGSQAGRSISSAADLGLTHKTIHIQHIHDGKQEAPALLTGNKQLLNNFKSIPEGQPLPVNSPPKKMLEFHNSSAKGMENSLLLNDGSSFWGAPAPLTLLPTGEQTCDAGQTLERIAALL